MDKYVVTKAEIDGMAGEAKTHFLNDKAKRGNKSLGDVTGIRGFGFHIIEIAPGYESTEFHCHYHEDECVYVLEGTAEAKIGDTVTTVQAGDFIGYRAGGEAHVLRNTGSELLRCIVVGQRLAHDVAEYPDQQKRLFRQQGMPWNLVDIADVTEPHAGKK